MSEQPGVPSHKLSKKSKDSKFDTFIFQQNGLFTMLLAGFNQSKIQADVRTIHRWLRLLMPEDSQEFELRPVKLDKSCWPFRYIYSDIGNPVAAGTNLLECRDYGFFWTGQDELTSGTTRVPFRDDFMSPSSFATLIATDPTETEVKLYKFDAPREARVTARDVSCFFTGSCKAKAQMKVAWIIPPAWSSQFDHGEENPVPFQKDENAVLLRSDLEPDWHNNKFAVDVEDHHRIVRFFPLSEGIEALLPKYLPSIPDPAMDEFLRKHFTWCLRVNVEGADISREISDPMIIGFCETVGLVSSEDEIERPPPEDEKWTTVIGQEIVALESAGTALFKHKAYLNF